MPLKNNATPKGKEHHGKQYCECCKEWKDNHHFSFYRGGQVGLWWHPWCNTCRAANKVGARKAYEHRRAKLKYQTMTPEQRRQWHEKLEEAKSRNANALTAAVRSAPG